MPKREYIGGKDYRVRTMARIPGFTRKIWERANAYGVDPNLILHRIGKEGWVDQLVQRYNALDAEEQNDAFWRNLWDEQVAGYGSFGLDYAGSNLLKGLYSLKDPNATWHEAEFDDEEGGKQFRKGTSLIADNLSSAIEILAADMAYRQGQVGKLYGKTDRDLNTWTNASFNMGLHHKDLKNDEYIQGKYTYPDYYTDFGLDFEPKSFGGLIQRYGNDRLQKYFVNGGSIHIKPSHRGRLTELKKRTGKSEAELYNDGNPAHKKMVVFARNARKWKHADGGLLNSFDMGGDKENDALAKAIIARVNQEEAAKKLREGRKMSEQPLIDEHPGLDLALIYAQPGGILAKAMAPSIAKGTVNSLVSGNTEGLLASLIPGGAQVQKLSGAVKATRPLTEAERLGVPKGLRANPKALEDPYYWGYRQWNQRYNDAVKAGNIEEAQKLRDLHFQTKAFNNQLQVDGHPITLYHGNIGSDSQLASAGYNPYSTIRTAVGSSGYFAVADPQIASTYKSPSGSIKTVYGYSKNPAVYNAEGRNWQDALVKEESGHRVGVRTDAVVNSAFDSGHDAVLIDNVVDYGFYTPASHPRQPFTDYVFKPGNVKLKDAVVEDGLFFEPIPIVKRDNFHNPDIRYGAGGLLRRFDDGTPGEVVSPDWNWQDTMYSYRSPEAAESDVVIPYATDDMLSEMAVVLPEQETPQVTKQIGRTHNIERGNLLQEIDGASSSIQRDSFLSSSALAILQATPIEVNLDSNPVTVPQRDTASYFATTASRLVDEANRFNAKGKTRDEIIAIQRELADAGYYSGYLSGKSKDEIKAIQTKLINKGLLSNRKKSDGTYAEADGIVGERTRAAWNQYNVDGKWGARSDEAYKTRNRMQGNGDDNKWENDFREGVDGCARWVTQKYESVLGNVSGQNGVFGNAWQMPKNIVRKGGTMLFNLYDEGFNGVSSTSDLKQRTKSELSKNKPDLSVLQPGDVVGIFFPNSSHHGDVLREGTTYNTHVGMIVAYDNDGTPIVQHNMGGNERKDRADKLPWGSQITVATRPATSGAMDTYPWKMGESKYEVELPEKFENMATEENKAKLKTYMDSMAGGADVIGRIYTNADMDAVQRIAIGVLGRETGFMQNTESSRTGKAGARVKAEKLIRSIVRDENPETKSSDLTKFKLSNLSPNERAFLGITSARDLEKPEKAGLASMYVLAKNYDYFVRYAKENPQLGLTKQDIEDLTALSYNQGMSKLYQVGTVEFGGERRVAPGILDSIREAASSDEAIDDFSATKLGRVAHEYPMLTGLMREMYNHGMGNRSSSYMNAARQAIQSIKAKR